VRISLIAFVSAVGGPGVDPARLFVFAQLDHFIVT